MLCNPSTLAQNARDVGSIPALGTIFPIFVTPTTYVQRGQLSVGGDSLPSWIYMPIYEYMYVYICLYICLLYRCIHVYICIYGFLCVYICVCEKRKQLRLGGDGVPRNEQPTLPNNRTTTV